MLIKTYYLYIYKFIYIFCLKFLIRFLFYFNPNYEKSPYIKNPERNLKRSTLSWEKIWEVRNAAIKHKYTDPVDFDLLYTGDQLKEVETRIRRHEVLDFPIVWQPGIVDEADDWRYRKSSYLRKGILRIVLTEKWELENLNDVQKANVLFRFFGPLFLIPLLSAWLFVNRMEIFHICVSYVLLNNYLINYIGLEQHTVYSAVVRLYFTNYIDQAVDHLKMRELKMEDQIINSDWVSNIKSDTSPNVLYIKRGVHNFLIVNKIVTENVHYYKEDKLSNFICKEILIDLTAWQKIRIKEAEDYMLQNATIIDKFRNRFWQSVWYYGNIPIPFTKISFVCARNPILYFDQFGPSTEDIKKGFCYDPNNEFSVWAFENAIIPGKSWRPHNWWRYDFCGGRTFEQRIILSNFPTIIEEIRSVEYKYIYPSDLAISLIKKIYKMIKPEDTSSFWTFTTYLDRYLFRYFRRFFNLLLRNFNYWLGKESKFLFDSIVEKYTQFVLSKNKFVALLKSSWLGPYLFLEQKPGFWDMTKSKKIENTKVQVWRRNGDRFFNSVPYNLVYKGGDSYGGLAEIYSVDSLRCHDSKDRGNKDADRRRLGVVIGFGFVPYQELGAIYPISNYCDQDDTVNLSTSPTAEKKAPLSELKDEGALFSSLDIFWVDYDLGINMFANSIFLNLLVDFLAIILLFSLFVFNTKSIKIYNSYTIKKVYFFFWDLFKNLVLNIRLERFFFVIVSYFLCIIFFNLGGFSFYELSFMSHVSITFFF